MDSPNSLLIGFYALLSYSYSQRHTYLTLGSWKRDIGAADVLLTTGSCTKTDKKKIFPLPLFHNRFPHCQEYCLGKRRISYTSQKPFLNEGSGYKRGCLL